MSAKDFEILDERFRRCIRTSASVDRLFTGCRWTEGSRVLPGAALARVQRHPERPRAAVRRRIRIAVSVFRRPADYTNGNTLDRQGRLVSCQHGARRVIRTEHDGSITVLADRVEGKRFNSPNDVVVKSDDSIWFTDPSYGIDSNYEGISRRARSAIARVPHRWTHASSQKGRGRIQTAERSRILGG